MAAISGSEIVWLKDLTAIFQTQKRIFGNTDLPDQLVFHVRRGSGVLTLNLKRNYEIDPNADMYLVERTKDGRSILSKATTLERKKYVAHSSSITYENYYKYEKILQVTD
ncbi:hypothetical protein CHS0354_010466 [Potamilus streckersoni]|uniref:Uncharacterized protein n=1 Tax=Potamilus streckersoni TaxID=2493646 RepID=A0AAE0TF49_9BIVA|nr:hypothetical protein CHS0354_010466 [Potamilus streckersoni]